LGKVDLTYLLSITDGNKELFLEIIDIFVIQVEEIWIEMQVLFDKQEFELVGNLAHKAKSSVAIMGMENMAGDLKKLELFCHEKVNLEMCQSIIINFKTECLQVIQELEAIKKIYI